MRTLTVFSGNAGNKCNNGGFLRLAGVATRVVVVATVQRHGWGAVPGITNQ